jgi:hypothetical protein
MEAKLRWRLGRLCTRFVLLFGRFAARVAIEQGNEQHQTDAYGDHNECEEPDLFDKVENALHRFQPLLNIRMAGESLPVALARLLT